jgi:uncharacterized protein YfaP (DUF2135 family)
MSNSHSSTTLPVLAGSAMAMLAGQAMAADAPAQMSIGMEAASVAGSNQSVRALAKMSDKELVGKYGRPTTMNIDKAGQVERTWNLTSGQLRVTNQMKTGKVTQVKFFENKTPEDVRKAMSRDMP